jgi:hypothetical protein
MPPVVALPAPATQNDVPSTDVADRALFPPSATGSAVEVSTWSVASILATIRFTTAASETATFATPGGAPYPSIVA